MLTDPPFDVIVYCATAGGVMAAIAAAREKQAVQRIDIIRPQEKLAAQRQVLEQP